MAAPFPIARLIRSPGFFASSRASNAIIQKIACFACESMINQDAIDSFHGSLHGFGDHNVVRRRAKQT